MRFDIATYALTSTLTFTVAFVISLRLFVESELYKSVSECYAAYDVEPIDSTLRLLREGAPFPFRFHRQMPAPACNGYIATYFNYVESQKISLLFHTNMAICCAIVMGSIIIKVFFGELWPMESQVGEKTRKKGKGRLQEVVV
ncbi:uncharacterized protein BYT42DRAFT_30663 [Radiomyces spectabilis]|uniref:uncharacterized protein n=1 Tax=Radiomyces spectabilis TaxID=64574 RepID=UPI00221F89A1|nr:uncharacterized protein BYT42DRAFT_30663 [Radiomyces spectabilis]KAI8394097.1 hypothetical protein BYT42DRAFT_30663 [Radiomyces spectabilis]